MKKIEEKRHLNAFVNLYAAEATERALLLDNQRAAGLPSGKLHGVIIGIKDVICYKDHPVTAASGILKGFTSIYNATVVDKLLAEGAIIIGHLNCDEFAMGSTNENSIYGKVLNALDETRVPGGSSGGSAVAVQAGLCMTSLGSDTGGSVRQPADFCGIVGIKPTYGRVSRYGLIAYASSFDQVGVFGNNIPDTALVLEVISGPDDYDSTTAAPSTPVADQTADPFLTGSTNHAPSGTASPSGVAASKGGIPSLVLGREELEAGGNRKFRIAYFKDAFTHKGLDQEIGEQFSQCLDQLDSAGHTVEGIDFEYLDYIVPTYYVLTTAEASSNLARFDGVKYGYRGSGQGSDLTAFYKETRSAGFGEEVKRRILLGTFVLSAGYYDAYFTKAQQVRKLLVDRTELIFNNFDIIILPTSPTTAFPIGEKKNDPIAMYLADIYTVYANLAGIPGISIPLFRHSNGMPFGMQAMTNRFNELSLLQFSHQMMQQYKSY